MLVLTRKAGESIVISTTCNVARLAKLRETIADAITVTVEYIYRDKVRLTIDAPRGVTVRMGEDEDPTVQGPEAAR